MKLPDSWKENRLKDIAVHKTAKNKDLKYTETYTNSATLGIVRQMDYFDKEISNKENIAGYYIVEEGDYVYNPRISASAPCGPISKSHIKETGIMSPLYTVFKITEKNLSDDYLEQYFKSTFWHSYMKTVANYGARYDRMNITTEDFFNIPIPFPPLAEQQKIADILCEQDKIISLKQKLLEQKQKQKKWLMQKLLEVPHSNANCEEKFPLGGVMIDKNGWKKDRLGHVSSISTGYKPKKVLKSGNYLFINAGCEYSGFTDDFNALADSITTPSRGQGGIGFIAYQYQDFWCGPLCYQIRDNTEQNNNKYMYYYLNYTNKNIKDLVQVGTIPAVNLTDLEKIYIHLPTLPEQRIIAQVLSTADKEIALLKSSIEQEKQKKKSLAQLLLTGTVRVKT